MHDVLMMLHVPPADQGLIIPDHDSVLDGSLVEKEIGKRLLSLCCKSISIFSGTGGLT